MCFNDHDDAYKRAVTRFEDETNTTLTDVVNGFIEAEEDLLNVLMDEEFAQGGEEQELEEIREELVLARAARLAALATLTSQFAR